MTSRAGPQVVPEGAKSPGSEKGKPMENFQTAALHTFQLQLCHLLIQQLYRQSSEYTLIKFCGVCSRVDCFSSRLYANAYRLVAVVLNDKVPG